MEKEKNKFILVILLFLLFIIPIRITPQIIIKERVVINPQNTIQKLMQELSVLSTHPVVIQIIMSKNVYCYYNWAIQQLICGIPSGTAIITPPGSNEKVTVQGVAYFDVGGIYAYNISWNLDGRMACGQNAEIKAFVNDSLVNTISIQDACSSSGNIEIIVPPAGCQAECNTTASPVAPYITFDKYIDDEKYCSEASDYGYTNLFDSNNLIGYYSIDVCYNTDRKTWQISYQPDNIHIYYYSNTCDAKIKARFPKILINNVNDVMKKCKDKMKQAKVDFEILRKYGRLPDYPDGIGYYEMFVEHENQHQLDAFNLVDSSYQQIDFINKFLSFNLSCEATNGKKIEAKKKAQDYVKNLLSTLKTYIYNKELQTFGNLNDDGTPDWIREEYEKNTQRKVYKKLYLKYKRVFPNLKWGGM